MNIYVQLEKNANKYSFFLYITLDTCHEGRGACSRPPPTRVREKPRRKEPGCPWSQLQAWDICKDLELQEASPRSGSCLENGLPTDSFSEWPMACNEPWDNRQMVYEYIHYKTQSQFINKEREKSKTKSSAKQKMRYNEIGHQKIFI